MRRFTKGDVVRHKADDRRMVFLYEAGGLAGKPTAMCDLGDGRAVPFDLASLVPADTADADLLQRVAALEGRVARLEQQWRSAQSPAAGPAGGVTTPP
jgi:hypothetical protein